MNNDLISRKALVKALLAEREHFPPMVEERYSFGVKLPHHFNQAMRGGIRKALRAVETAPAVDAEPVRHGRVIETVENGKFKRIFSCCGTDFTKMTMWMTPRYCPHCGAKMDGGAE